MRSNFLAIVGVEQAKLDSAVTQRRELQDDFHAADTHAKDMVAEVEALQVRAVNVGN